jgi:GNAT superfamily N-acetyltransferase
MVEFVRVDLAVHRDMLVALNEEYLGWIADQLREYYGIDATSTIRQTVREYAEKSVEEIAALVPPEGIFYLLELDGDTVGMGGLRKIRKSAGEIKRMYVRPSHRGAGLGRSLLQRLLDSAREFGFSLVLLETGQFMAAAQGLYRSMGFRDRPEYPETEVPKELRRVWLFMEKHI